MVVWDVGTFQQVPGIPFLPILEHSFHRISHITFDMKCAGARSAGNLHATCDAAGVGDGITATPNRARRWKRRKQPRKFLRIHAPALDPPRISLLRTYRLYVP